MAQSVRVAKLSHCTALHCTAGGGATADGHSIQLGRGRLCIYMCQGTMRASSVDSNFGSLQKESERIERSFMEGIRKIYGYLAGGASADGLAAEEVEGEVEGEVEREVEGDQSFNDTAVEVKRGIFAAMIPDRRGSS